MVEGHTRGKQDGVCHQDVREDITVLVSRGLCQQLTAPQSQSLVQVCECVETGAPLLGSVSGAEFDQFLAQRALKADETAPLASRPRPKMQQKAEDASDELFSL